MQVSSEMQILEILILVWVNTYYGQSPTIREQVDSHHADCVNWLDREGLLREYNRLHHHRKGLIVSIQRFLLAGENEIHV